MSENPFVSNASRRIVLLRELKLDAHIGVYKHEQGVAQPVIINVKAHVIEPENLESDSISDVFCYSKLTDAIKAIIADGHINLVETLAERIARYSLDQSMVSAVFVRVEKPLAISEAAGAGVEIFRSK